MKRNILTLVFLLLAFASFACDAVTKSGTKCTRKPVHNGFCKMHDPASIHCAGKTKAGQPCKNLPQKGTNFCHLHN